MKSVRGVGSQVQRKGRVLRKTKGGKNMKKKKVKEKKTELVFYVKDIWKECGESAHVEDERTFKTEAELRKFIYEWIKAWINNAGEIGFPIKVCKTDWQTFARVILETDVIYGASITDKYELKIQVRTII
jgi:CRISPR/Cas system-associated endonuclease/helicase Cas3